MATDFVTLPGRELRKVTHPTGLITYTERYDDSATTFSENRTNRVRRPRPVGWRNPTAYSLVSYTQRCPTGMGILIDTANRKVEFSGDILRANNNFAEMNPLPVPSGMVDRCVVEALLSLKDQSVNIGVALAEAQQTADLVGSTAKRLAQGYRALKSRDGKGFRRAMGLGSKAQIPNSWLEAQYAWKPLLSDVKGAWDELKGRPDYRWVTTAKGSERVRETVGRVDPQSDINNMLTGYREVGCFVRLDYVPGNTFFGAMSRVGMTNPLEVLWEKVPFSFVVDWFLPVGDFLSSMDAAVGWTFKSGSRSILQRNAISIAAGPPRTSGLGNYLKGDWKGSYKRVELSRIVYGSSPLPKAPRFKNPLSLGHMANGLSLLASVFGGRR